MFSMRSEFKENPNFTLVFTFIVSGAVLAYMLRICERPLSNASGQNFNYLFTALWNIVVTMTTVGYGEFWPKTYFGWIIGSFICFWGCLLVSLFVVSISEALAFTAPQNNAYILIQRMLYRESLKKYASNVVSKLYKWKRLEYVGIKQKRIIKLPKRWEPNRLTSSTWKDSLKRNH